MPRIPRRKRKPIAFPPATPGMRWPLEGLAPLFAAAAVSAALTDCQKSIVQQTTNIFENSQKNFAFDYCADINDGRGYTCGIVGFTTATHDAYDVVKTYATFPNYTAEFDPYLSRLAQINESGTASTSGLAGFCDAWYAAASNSAFRQLQVAKADSLYYAPSQNLADLMGLTLPVSRGQFYDAAVQMGTAGDTDSLPSVAARTPRPADMAEAEWIGKFMEERARTLCNPADRATQKAWCASRYRVASYQHVLATSQANFTDSLTVLDNDGREVVVGCDLDLWTTYVPGPRPSAGLSAGAVASIVVSALVVMAAVAFLLRRRLRKRSGK